MRPDQQSVEEACEQLRRAGKRVTFPAVAALSGVSRATLYRREDLRSVVEGFRRTSHGASRPEDVATELHSIRLALIEVMSALLGDEESLGRIPGDLATLRQWADPE